MLGDKIVCVILIPFGYQTVADTIITLGIHGQLIQHVLSVHKFVHFYGVGEILIWY